MHKHFLVVLSFILFFSTQAVHAGKGPTPEDLAFQQERFEMLKALASESYVKKAFVCIFAKSQYGLAFDEHALFIQINTDKTLSEKYVTYYWPFQKLSHMARFEGPIPKHTIAIAHTHPRTTHGSTAISPAPSDGDQQTANRLSMLNYVISAEGVWVYDFVSKKNYKIATRQWLDDMSESDKASACEWADNQIAQRALEAQLAEAAKKAAKEEAKRVKLAAKLEKKRLEQEAKLARDAAKKEEKRLKEEQKHAQKT